MSRVYFHSLSRETELYGTERAYAGNLVSELALVPLDRVLNTFGKGKPMILDWLPKDHYMLDSDFHDRGPRGFKQTFGTWWHVGFDDHFLSHPETEERYWPFTVSLNTAVVSGSDPIRLLGRMHGQCEIHGYMEGEDRAFIADVIEEGRKGRILRPDAGWENVIEHLRERDDEPVVTSYSVTESFPNPYVVKETGIRHLDCDHKIDEWYDLTDKEKWDDAMAAIRKMDEHWFLRWSEDRFRVQGFGNGVSAYDLVGLVYDYAQKKESKKEIGIA